MAEPWNELNAFALNRLNASAYADCSHRFRLLSYEQCKELALRLTVERHAGDTPGDFQGRLRYLCVACAHCGFVLGSVGMRPAEVLDVSDWACQACAHDICLAASVDRWDEGFFDEGTVVSRCEKCEALAPVVDTD
ncbi:MAG: hypothetical protein GY898_27145 [Proteobacteria bacterium]|nr:hypothetical protein [Pseudomonadota bacterium]